MRMEAAIHMLGTLKSINEGSLSDWQAVIADEISQQKEKQEEKEETLREVIEMMKALPVSSPTPEKPEGAQNNDEILAKEIDSIRSEIRLLATQVSGVAIKANAPAPQKIKIESRCPQCEKALSYRQRSRLNSTKAINCPHCAAKLISLRQGDAFVLSERHAIQEKVECPNCHSILSFSLDPPVGSSADVGCKSCHCQLRATRRPTFLRLRFLDKASGKQSPNAINEEPLLRVKEAMGQQPWPTRRSHHVADRLNIPHSVVSQALQVLIARGDFLLQQNGKLYAPVDKPSAVGSTPVPGKPN